jgi:hypothetical protein
MHLIAPDVLAEAQGLSPLLSSIGVVIGGLVWLFGWHWHRFWVVAAITVAGGLIGLQTGKASGGHILAMGVLLALSAGLLALELARVISFLAAGMAVWLAVSALFPRAQELWIAFLIGGVLGVLLYRFWTMLLTSFAGAMFAAHSALCLADELFSFNAAAFASTNALMLNGGLLVAACLGVVVQSLHERWHLRRTKQRKAAEKQKMLEKEREKILAGISKPSAPPPSLWGRLLGKRKAA